MPKKKFSEYKNYCRRCGVLFVSPFQSAEVCGECDKGNRWKKTKLNFEGKK